jgi:hypothetical protein
MGADTSPFEVAQLPRAKNPSWVLWSVSDEDRPPGCGLTLLNPTQRFRKQDTIEHLFAMLRAVIRGLVTYTKGSLI